MVAQHHADGRVDDLGGDTVAILVGQPCDRIPAAAMQFFEFHAGFGDVFRLLARGGDEAKCDRPVHAVDDEHVAVVLGGDDVRRPVAERAVDVPVYVSGCSVMWESAEMIG